MKQFTILLTIALLLSACGAQPAPTMDPADVQLSAVAAAFTIVAETQAALPTETPLPPTETASPTLPATNTAVALPTSSTLAPTITPAAAAGGGAAAGKGSVAIGGVNPGKKQICRGDRRRYGVCYLASPSINRACIRR